MRIILLILVVLLTLTQYKLWFGEGNLHDVHNLQQEANRQREENSRLLERNRVLEAEVTDLKQGLEAVEERARSELGMIREGEVFYQVIEPAGADK